MKEHRFAEGVIRGEDVYRFCTHCNLVLFHYKGTKRAQVLRDTERAYYKELARINNVR